MARSQYQLADFAQDIESRYKTSEPETFWRCEEPIVRFLSEGAVSQWLNQQLRSLIGDDRHLGDWSATEAILHRSNAWTFSVSVFDTPRRFIHALPFLALYAPLDGELTCERYRLPEGYRNDVFDPGLRLEAAGTVRAGRGEVLRLETDRYAYDFHVPRPLTVLRFVSAPLRPMEWLFSKSTLQAWQANDADLSSTQLRVAAFVLGKIAHQSSIGPLRQLAAHPHHAVRWAAIQSLGRLSRSEALVKIREAVNDPHPHVRRAAQKTLDALERRRGA
ncbi:MAG: HEAT repeat domain-containing protein [Woeseiaceae bacterium]